MTALYDAFISYSHAKDKPVTSALQSVMQSLGKPWYRRRALRIFRDDTSLAATPELWPTLEQVLGRSRYIVLLVSPQFAMSKWCGLEVAWWLEHKSIDTMLMAVTDGELAWDEASGDFRWDGKTPLPPVLRGKFRAEPKWIDLRAHRDAPGRNDAKFVDAAADIAAAIHGLPKEDLLSQEVRQQKRALTLASSAALVLLILGGLAVWQWAEAARQERIARQQRDRAELALSAATQTANTLVLDLAREFQDRAGIPSDLVRRILDRARSLQDQLMRSGEISPALLQSAGIALDALVVALLDLGEPQAALEAAERSRDTVRRLADTEPGNTQWRRELSVSYNKIGYVLQRLGRREEALAAHREALAIAEALLARDSTRRQFQRDVEISLVHIGDALSAVGRREEALTYFRRAHATAADFAAAHPEDDRAQRDLAVMFEKIGDMLIETKDVEEALAAYRKSAALREQLAARDPGSIERARDVSVITDRLADALARAWRYDDALTAFRKGLSIRERLAVSDPANAARQSDLTLSLHRVGDMLLKLRRPAEALPAFERALAISERLAGTAPENAQQQRDFAISTSWVGDALLALTRSREALAYYQRSLALRQQLAARDPDNAAWQEDLALGLGRVADVQASLGEKAEAVENYRKSAAISERLMRSDAANGRLRRAYVVTLNRLAAVLTETGQSEAGLAVYRQGLTDTEVLTDLDPTNAQWQTDLQFVLNRIAGLLMANARADEAVPYLRRGVAVAEKLSEADPDNTHLQRNLSIGYEALGRALASGRAFDAALEVYAKALRLRERRVQAVPQPSQATPAGLESQQDLYFILANMAAAEEGASRAERATTFRRRAEAVARRLAEVEPSNKRLVLQWHQSLREIAKLSAAAGKKYEAIAPLTVMLGSAERMAAAEPEEAEWQKQTAIALYQLATVGDAKRARLMRALEIARQLAASGKLGPAENGWVDLLEKALAALPS